MIGCIGVEDLKVSCRVGVEPHERLQLQDLFVDVMLETDIGEAAHSDHLHDSINYQQVADSILTHVQDKEFHLIERVAYELIELLFAQFPANWVWIKVKKPQAIALARQAIVELERFRDEDEEEEDEDDE